MSIEDYYDIYPIYNDDRTQFNFIKRRNEMKTKLPNHRFYSTRSAIEHPAMLCPTMSAAIEAAERKLTNNGEEMIYIVQIVAIVKRHEPQPKFDVIKK